MRIGEAARAAGVGVETIRYYERRGLIARPARPVRGGARSYPEETIARIRFIREAQSIGFSLREIKELASLKLDPDADCGEVKARAKAKLDEVDRKIAGLGAMRAKLEQVVVACPGRGRLDQCAILAALSTGGGGNKAKVSQETLDAIRSETTPDEAKDAALVQFVRRVVRDRGWVPESEVKAFVDAGYSEAQVLDVITAVALKTLSNYSNHITNPALNPELEKFAWQPEAKQSKAG